MHHDKPMLFCLHVLWKYVFAFFRGSCFIGFLQCQCHRLPSKNCRYLRFSSHGTFFCAAPASEKFAVVIFSYAFCHREKSIRWMHATTDTSNKWLQPFDTALVYVSLAMRYLSKGKIDRKWETIFGIQFWNSQKIVHWVVYSILFSKKFKFSINFSNKYFIQHRAWSSFFLIKKYCSITWHPKICLHRIQYRNFSALQFRVLLSTS